MPDRQTTTSNEKHKSQKHISTVRQSVPRLPHLALVLGVLLGSGLTAIQPAFGQSGTIVYNPADQFSVAANPNGTWSYGMSESLGSPFEIYVNGAIDGHGIRVDSWWGDESGVWGFYPYVGHNPSLTEWGLVDDWFEILPPNGFMLHPGPHGEVSIVRWTAQLQ